MPLFSPQLMKRKRNNNQIFNYFWWMLLRKKIWKFINTVKLMIIWIFKQLNSLNKIKLSHKLPSKQNYLLSKTFTFDNSNSHCLEQIRFIALSFFGFELSRVNYSCSHFFSLAGYLVIHKISFSFSWIAIQILL